MFRNLLCFEHLTPSLSRASARNLAFKAHFCVLAFRRPFIVLFTFRSVGGK